MNDLGVSLHDHGGLTFLDAAKALNAKAGKIEIDPRYLAPGFGWPGRDDSPVVGIKRTIPAFVDPGLGRYLDDGPGGNFTGSIQDFAAGAKHRLKQDLRHRWDTTRPTLFVHSSGWDSRILSQCLAELRDEGFNLGEVFFRCREPEQVSFLKVMKRQGWDPNQYSVYVMPSKDPLDVGAWDRPGVSPWLPVTSQINFWRDMVPYEDEKFWNLIGGSGGGEAVEYPSLGKLPTVPWHFCLNRPVQRWFSYFPDGTDFAADIEARFAKVLFPFFSAGHILTIGELPERFLGFHKSGADNVRAAVLETFKDSTLDIPRQPRVYGWSISPERWNEMHTRYASSAFVREVPGAPKPAALLNEMQRCFFTKASNAERIWRLAALYEVVRAS